MEPIAETFRLAAEHHAAGRREAAEECCRRVIATEPRHADAWHLLGIIAFQAGNYAEAIERIQQAIGLRGSEARFHNNLGAVYKHCGRLDDAVACYQLALQIDPHSADAYNNLGFMFGFSLTDEGKLDDAAECFRRAIELNPALVPPHNNLARLCKAQGKLDEAAQSFQSALRLKADSPETLNELGAVLHMQGKLTEAVSSYRQALELKPQFVEALTNLGATLRGMGKLDEAVACLRQAMQLAPSLAEVHDNLGNALKDQGRLDEAIACYRQAIELKPDYPEAHSNLVYTLNFHPDYDAPAIYAEHCRWNEQHALPLAKDIKPHVVDSNAIDRESERRLRIGYVSPDFRDHVVGLNLLPLFRTHNRQRFEIVAYSDVLRPDAVTAQFQSHVELWRNIAGLGDEAVARQIRDDRIDILVDTTLHMNRNRLLVFARKPAPVQATFAGYPGTTGLTAIDYRLIDRFLDIDCDGDCNGQSPYSETSISIGDTFWCYDPPDDELAVNALPALRNGHVTFGCLNNFCKINRSVIRLWAEVLNTVDRSQLVLLAGEGSHRQQTLREFAREGVTSDRITFVGRQTRDNYLQVYHSIDLGLDTFPYNGHTTSLDSYWMGVPVITLVGQTAVGRAGFSQLSNLSMAHRELVKLITRSSSQFVYVANELVGNLEALSKLRATLREHMQRSPLMNAVRFARNIEAVYESIWLRIQRSSHKPY